MFSIIATQLAFSYVAAPFVILSLSGSLKVWARVFFFGHVGIIASMAFFGSPAKKWLQTQQQKRVGRAQVSSDAIHKEGDFDGGAGPLGLPEDPVADLEEVRQELIARRNSILEAREKAKEKTTAGKAK